jgi:hypothetical protein
MCLLTSLFLFSLNIQKDPKKMEYHIIIKAQGGALMASVQGKEPQKQRGRAKKQLVT